MRGREILGIIIDMRALDWHGFIYLYKIELLMGEIKS